MTFCHQNVDRDVAFYDASASVAALPFYKSYFFGFNDSCPTARLNILDIIDNLAGLSGSDGVEFDATNQAVQNFRKNSVGNTYAETDLFTNPVRILSEFDIGVPTSTRAW